ncbi:CYFA0S04e00210g1_1 [Cyberlindnera fabianii]|uniref:Succinate dehydrogenase assembly factor 2, mitochondrial n=1 Tax=Cyberlindnera fabianii TaxID=36022 RepID=A0A061AWW1_CYBFA|nr:Succinate dehydrogenase assembly factor 2, mitochondrial [Cyberlindnera fabianii]CDR39885.1 CYFA0S04e00210g1_1 [Cyberlindnera fabianii]
MFRLTRLQQRTSLVRFYSSKPSYNSPGVVTGKDADSNDIVKIQPLKREGESIDRKRARLTYQSRKRGILETDLLLSRFSKKYLNTFTNEELDEYSSLLDELDWDIYYWATRNYDVTPLPDKWKDSKILKMLQDFSENKEKVVMRMPDLH